MPPRRPRVFVDAQAFQNQWSAERGIGRYLGELLAALRRSDAVVQLTYVLNPDLPVPPLAKSLAASGRVTFSDRLSPGDGDVFHSPSPFEPAAIDRLWPPAVRDIPLVVTVHDLIPFVLTDLYLRDPTERRWFKTRLEFLRRADRVIAVSRTTARDVIEQAALPSNRVVVISEGPPERFRPAQDRAAAMRKLQRLLPGIRADFVFYQGGMDYRKNVRRLLQAYAGLPVALRRRHQLVVACGLTKGHREEVDRLLAEFAVATDVFFPGYVADEILVLLYQCAKLSIFPSLYEGFGLPVAESVACGTPVIASGTSSIPEVIENRQALFDPYDPVSIREMLRRALEDHEFLERLRDARLQEHHSWHHAAEQTATVYASASRALRRRYRSRPRLAVVSPLPRYADSAKDTNRLLAALARRCAVDSFGGDSRVVYPPPGVEIQRLARFDLIERARGGYDAILSVLENDRDAAGALAVARTRGGHVLLRNPVLTRLYAWCARERPDIEPRGFAGALRSMYGSRLPRDLADQSEISPSDADRYGILMAREVVAAADRVFVHSAYAKQLVELDADAADAEKIAVLPTVFPTSAVDGETRERLVVARAPREEAAARTLFEALALLATQQPDVRFGIVAARKGRRLRATTRRHVEAYELGSRTTVASERDVAEWGQWLPRAAAAVQLGDTPELVVPRFVTESMAAGVPLIASNAGPVRELPDDALVKLPVGASSETAATAIQALLDAEQSAIGLAAAAYAQENSVERLAERVYDLMFA